jgi:AraC-like DNA-binding protein
MTGVSPLSYMRARALHEVRRELASGAARSVTDAAFMWGFTELGRFARAYRDHYGELPRETLRTGRRRFGRVPVQTR